MSQGIDREQLEEKIVSQSEREILEITDKVCPDGFLTNRKRLELVRRIDDYILDVKMSMIPSA